MPSRKYLSGLPVLSVRTSGPTGTSGPRPELPVAGGGRRSFA
jgi:hypothetical protein